MDWTTILSILTLLLGGLNIFQLVTFRSIKKKYQMEAEKDVAVSSLEKQTALESRLDAVEKLYAEQGKLVDELRKEILELKKEKFASDKRIVKLESENKSLKDTVSLLEEEVKAYRTISRNHGEA